MAQLKDTIVSGNLRVTDTTLTDTLQVTIIKAPTSSNETTYGPGTSGQVLKSNGTSVYWGSDSNSVTGVKGNAESSYRTGNVNLTPANIGALPTTTNYAASSSVGGAATSANKLNTNAGATNRPVYFSDGVPVQCDTPASGSWFKGVPLITTDGVMEFGKYIDFHNTNGSKADYDYRMEITTTTMTLHATGSSNTLTIKSPGNTQLSFQTTSSGKAYTSSGITCYPLTTSGMTSLFNFGGNLVIGGGESAKTLYDNNYDTIKTVENEDLYLCADNDIHIVTGCKTYADKSIIEIDAIGKVYLPSTGGIIVKQRSDSNYVSATAWWNGGTAPNSGEYAPQIGQHNTGGDSSYPGSICILPYKTTTNPWGGQVGLFIKKDHVYIDGVELSKSGHTHNYAGSSSAGGAATSANKLNTDAGGTYLPVYFNNGVPEAVTVKNNTSKGTIGWTSGAAANAALVTVNSIAYWNGAYSGTSSNLAYCNKGEFGSIVTKSTTDYSKVSFSRNLTSGTKVGTITIDGTSTDLYCETNTNTTYSAGTGLSLSGTTFNHSNSVTVVTNYNKPYVRYDAQGHITGSSYWTATAAGTGGEGGWIKVATMVHTDIHDDTPIMLLVSQRGNTITYKLHIVWKNTGNTDPDINKFRLSSDIDTNADAYIKKSTTSTWELYIKKLDNWDAIAMHLYVGKYFPDHMTWTWQDVQTAESAITGGTEATKIVPFNYHTSRTANTVLAAPNGSDGKASFRKLVAADIPSHTHNYAGSSSAGGAATKVATEVGSSAGARPVFYAYLGDNTRVVYNTNFTYNPSGNVLTAGMLHANIFKAGKPKTTDGAAKGQVKFFSGNPNDATGTVTLECVNDAARTGDYTVKLPTWNGTIPVFEKLFEGASNNVSLSFSDINEYDLFLITVANSNATTEQVTVASLWISNIAGVHDMPLIWGGTPSSSGGACNVTSGWIQLTKNSGTTTFVVAHKSKVAQMTNSGWSISSPTYNLYIRKIFGLKAYKRT